MEKPPEGPVADWFRDVLTNIWAALKALVALIGSIPERLEARIDGLETKALCAAVVVIVVIGLYVFGHAWITRSRK